MFSKKPIQDVVNGHDSLIKSKQSDFLDKKKQGMPEDKLEGISDEIVELQEELTVIMYLQREGLDSISEKDYKE